MDLDLLARIKALIDQHKKQDQEGQNHESGVTEKAKSRIAAVEKHKSVRGRVVKEAFEYAATRTRTTHVLFMTSHCARNANGLHEIRLEPTLRNVLSAVVDTAIVDADVPDHFVQAEFLEFSPFYPRNIMHNPINPSRDYITPFHTQMPREFYKRDRRCAQVFSTPIPVLSTLTLKTNGRLNAATILLELQVEDVVPKVDETTLIRA